MISIILAASEECKRDALRAGFVEQSVLVRTEAVMGNPAEQARIEAEIRQWPAPPYQYLVSDFWGVGTD
jgi:hypothetical protein